MAAASLPLGHAAAQTSGGGVAFEQLAGATRYETAEAIARAFVAEAGTSMDTVILASGEEAHAACALPAAALAGRWRAPVLLTRPDLLSPAASRFLTEFTISRVFILGDTSVVSSDVERSVELLTRSDPIRLGGDDCYATSVAVAAHLGPPGSFGDRGPTVLLTTGEDYADGLAGGPLSYSGRHPLLLTRPAALDPGVAQLLDNGSIGHVIILGGPAAISSDIESAIKARGITAERWQGPDRFATAARIVSGLLNEGSPVGCFDGGAVGLATGFGSPDAIASAPLLGERCAPLLLTDHSSLPPVTALLLGSGIFDGNVTAPTQLTVFGGDAAISGLVVVGALRVLEPAPGATGPPVTAAIEAFEGACHWKVTFSEPVLAADAASAARYTFGGGPLRLSTAEVVVPDAVTTSTAIVLLAGASAYDSASVPTGCAEPVAVRDRLGVADGAIGAASGNRLVLGTEFLVRADTARPSLIVIAPVGGDTVWVRSSEPLQAASVQVTLTRGRSRLTAIADVSHGDTEFVVTFAFPHYDSYATSDVPFTEPPALRPGDRISIATAKLTDRAGNRNVAATRTVPADTAGPRVDDVIVSEPVLRADGTSTVDLELLWTEPVRGCGIGATEGSIDLGAIQIDVDGDGFAEFSLDGHGAAPAGVAFVAAPDSNEWALEGTAACDHSWSVADGTLVARLSASMPAALPHGGSVVVVHAGAAHDLVGNPAPPHRFEGFAIGDIGFG